MEVILKLLGLSLVRRDRGAFSGPSRANSENQKLSPSHTFKEEKTRKNRRNFRMGIRDWQERSLSRPPQRRLPVHRFYERIEIYSARFGLNRAGFRGYCSPQVYAARRCFSRDVRRTGRPPPCSPHVDVCSPHVDVDVAHPAPTQTVLLVWNVGTKIFIIY